MISILRPKTYARPIVEPQPTTLRLLHRNFQPFKTPQPLNSFVIHMPAFVAKHHRNTTITVPDIRSRQISHSFYQASFTSSGTCKVRRCVDRGWPRTRHDRRSETQSRPRRITYMLDRPTTLRRTQKFPEAASRRIALSRSASASNFFLSCPPECYHMLSSDMLVLRRRQDSLWSRWLSPGAVAARHCRVVVSPRILHPRHVLSKLTPLPVQ
jgi:hypothetical protein